MTFKKNDCCMAIIFFINQLSDDNLLSNFIIAFVGYAMYKTLDFEPRVELRDN